MLDVEASYALTAPRDDVSALSGSATAEIYASRLASGRQGESSVEFSVEAELTFTGNTATLVLDGEASYVINLDSGDATRR